MQARRARLSRVFSALGSKRSAACCAPPKASIPIAARSSVSVCWPPPPVGDKHRGLSLDGADLAASILDLWGEDIASAASQAGDSHGAQAMRLYGARGAREEALAGYPILMDLALPTLQKTLRRLDCPERASVQCLFMIMAHLQDTNLLHRGGAEGLSFVQNSAQKFLDEGGVFAPDWRRRALALHGDCVALHLSPGGAADCLAAAWFVHLLQLR